MSGAPDPMALAVGAALRGVRGANPLVGAVLTDDAGRVLAAGHHRGRGTAHAEVDALARWEAARAADPALAALDPAGLTLHVTLEPCDHTGSTGPCSGAILASGVGAVRYAVADPTGVDGGGAARLAAHGVRVSGPTGEPAALALTERWRRARDAGRPWITGHLAQSLDGHAAAADGTSRWITGAASRAHAHRVRARVDAIVVGTGTVLADDPRLTVRDAAGAETGPQPVPVVQGRTPIPAGAALRARPETLHVPAHEPEAVLAALAARPGPWPHGGARPGHVLIEGGPRVLGAWIRAGLVDELMVYTAPLLLGAGRPAVAGLDVGTLADGLRWHPDPAEDGPVRALGEDVWTHLAPVPAPAPEGPDPQEDCMFTGIVTHLGTVLALEPDPAADTARLVLDAGGALEGLPAGGSLAVDGVCLTALDGPGAEPGVFRADLMGQTLRMTSLGGRTPGDRVNLERCLRPTDHLDGHVVQGHVDGVGEVLSVTPQGAWTTVRIGLPAALARYVPAQGAIALQGVSLTVSAVSEPGADAHWFEVGLIPATLEATTLGALRPGDRVNLETDVLARYAERLALLPAAPAASPSAAPAEEVRP